MKIRWFPITAALAAADQAAKCYAENKLAKGEERAITDKVVLRHVQNEGVCMSFLEDEPETARIAALPESPCPEYADFSTCGFHVPDIDLRPGTSGGIIGGFSHVIETEYRFRYQAYIRIFSCYPFYMSFSEIVT